MSTLTDIGINFPNNLNIENVTLNEWEKDKIFNIIVNNYNNNNKQITTDNDTFTYKNISIQSLYESGMLFKKINNGDFTDLQIGNFFVITIPALDNKYPTQQLKCVLSDFDCYYKTGLPNSLDYHHAVIIPENCLYDFSVMSSSSSINQLGEYFCYTNSVAYINYSVLFKYLKYIENTIGGNHILYRKIFLSDYLDKSGTASGNFYFRKFELMGEMEVFGKRTYAAEGGYSTIEKQFKIFELNPEFIKSKIPYYYNSGNTDYYWLKDASTLTNTSNTTLSLFSGVTNNGSIYRGVGGEQKCGRRPCWLIG